MYLSGSPKNLVFLKVVKINTVVVENIISKKKSNLLSNIDDFIRTKNNGDKKSIMIIEL